jgi:hypothetical protein
MIWHNIGHGFVGEWNFHTGYAGTVGSFGSRNMMMLRKDIVKSSDHLVSEVYHVSGDAQKT